MFALPGVYIVEKKVNELFLPFIFNSFSGEEDAVMLYE